MSKLKNHHSSLTHVGSCLLDGTDAKRLGAFKVLEPCHYAARMLEVLASGDHQSEEAELERGKPWGMGIPGTINCLRQHLRIRIFLLYFFFFLPVKSWGFYFLF